MQYLDDNDDTASTGSIGGRGNRYQEGSNAMSYGGGTGDTLRNRSYASDTYASDTYADLVRNEYSDYKTRFQPYEKTLMSLADSEAMLDAQLSKIGANSASRYKQAKQNSALKNERYGIQANGRQSNYNNTQMDAQRGLAVSNAKNMSRISAADRQMGILSGSSTSRQTLADLQG